MFLVPWVGKAPSAAVTPPLTQAQTHMMTTVYSKNTTNSDAIKITMVKMGRTGTLWKVHGASFDCLRHWRYEHQIQGKLQQGSNQLQEKESQPC